jgi:hypothetical protein
MYIIPVQGYWLLHSIKNESDVVLRQGARFNNVVIPSVTATLVKLGVDGVVFDTESGFGSSGHCKIIAQDAQGGTFDFVFFDDWTHQVANGRAEQSDLASRTAALSLRYARMARIFIVEQGVYTLIGYIGYNTDKIFLDCILQGEKGSYQFVCKDAGL